MSILATQANAATQQVYSADGTASTSSATGIDLTDPESLISFFANQIQASRTELNSIVAEQQARNDLQLKIGELQSDLSGIADGSGLKPGDPGWDKFVADANAVLPSLDPTSTEAQAIQAAINPTTVPHMANNNGDVSNIPTLEYDTKTEVSADTVPDGAIPAGTPPDNATNVHYYATGGTYLTSDGQKPQYLVTYDMPGPANGMDKDAVSKLKAGLSSEVDSLKNDSQIAMIRVQQYTDQISQATTLLTNILKKLDDTAMAPINNMGR
jgi:hypothetical protein